MSISLKLKEYLEKEKISYKQSHHESAFTALEVAGNEHVPGKQFVKAVIIKADDKFCMCVLPAIHLVDFDKLKNVLKAKDIQLASEEEISKLFPEFEVGATPPFGHLKGLKVYADKLIEDDDEIVFSGGTHTDVVKIKCKDFIRLENPVMIDFGRHI